MTVTLRPRHRTAATRPVADELEPLARRLLGGALPVRLRAWDGSEVGPPDAAATVVLRSPDALRRMAFAPGELGLARAYVAGDLDLDGDVFAVLGARDHLGAPDEHVPVRFDAATVAELLRAARRLGALGRPLPPPPEEARLGGRRHSHRRDAAAVSHHYDVGNDFYRLLLGETMTYSCGYWPRPETTLDRAQWEKYDLICRKLGLGPGQRLLDVGCGWGSMVLHAAREYGVSAVGITVSRQQEARARERVAEAGLDHLVQIRYQDYRAVADGPFDAISSIGMFEHVGLAQAATYAQRLHHLVAPGGRVLNHAISRPEPGSHPAIDRHSFMGRYVFPDSELIEVGTVVSTMQAAGLEVRDVESLREHYGRTLRAWLTNLEAHWDEAVALAGPGRARVWRLYLAGCALGFEQGRISIHQTLAVRPDAAGRAHLPPTRTWLVPTVERRGR
jgi:cyclopropane-fatty-acyl-phospholipid synthase